MILLINIIAFAIPYLIIFIILSYFANKHNMPFKVAFKFNDYVKNTIGEITIFQFIILLIDLFIFFYVDGNNDYSTTEILIIVTCTNLMLFELAVSLVALSSISENITNIKKILYNKSIKF